MCGWRSLGDGAAPGDGLGVVAAVADGTGCALGGGAHGDWAGRAGGEVDADMALMDSGLDSLGAVGLSELLQKAAGGATLPGTLIFDQPTARRLTNYLANRMQDQGSAKTFVAACKKQAGDVLLLGLTTQLPGGAHSPKFASQMLADGHDAISEEPTTRWNTGAMSHLAKEAFNRMCYGGFVRRAQVFDARHFAVSPAEAAAMDPQ